MKELFTNTRAGIAISVLIYQFALLGCAPPPSLNMEDLREAERAKQIHSQQLAEMQKNIAAGSRDLVSADAVARKDWVAVQNNLEKARLDLLAQQDSLLSGHASLEQERKEIASQRLTHSAMAALIDEFGPVAVCCLPLLPLVILLLRSNRIFQENPIPEVVIEQLENRNRIALDSTEDQSGSLRRIPLSTLQDSTQESNNEHA